MKNILSALSLCLFFIPALYGFEINPAGSWSEGDISANWMLCSSDWTYRFGRNKNSFEPVDANSCILKEKGKSILFKTMQETKADGKIHVSSSVSSKDFSEVGHLAYELVIPLGKLRKLSIDGKKADIPSEFKQVGLSYSPEKAHSLSIETEAGTCLIEGAFSIFVQDNRKWGESISLRLNSMDVKKQEKYTIDFQIRFQPYQSQSIALDSSANMAFKDEEAGDAQGGWTDQGSSNDMRLLKAENISFAGVDFRLIAPSENNEKTCIVLSSSQKKFPASASVNVSGREELPFLYLLHAAAWVPSTGKRIGSVNVSYKDGKTGEYPVIAGQDCGNWWLSDSFKNAGIAWEAQNSESRIGLYASAFRLEGIPVSISFKAEENSVWMICAASFSDHGAEFDTIEKKQIITANSDWMPVKFKRRTEAGSPLDFSASLDAPAGKYGRVTADGNGHFVFENNPSKRIRFLGVNLCGTANFFDHKEAEDFAEEIAAIGYNSVRFHHFENLLLDKNSADSLSFDKEMLERLQYLITCLKQRGIYCTLDLYASRKLRSGDKIKNWNEQQNPKLLFNIEADAMENWKSFVKQLLNTENPYTGLSLANDPALYMVSLVNEDNISFNLPLNNDPLTAAAFRSRWESYLAEHKIAPGSGSDSGIYRHFLNELERNRIREQVSFLRNEIGTKVLVTDLNFITDYALSGIRSDLQVVDIHSYWDHMRLLKPGSWSPPLGFSQQSALGQGAAHIRGIMPGRVFGRPFVLTEANYCFPNRYRTEYGPMCGAYAALQDWDGIYRFAWSHGKEWIGNETIGGFDIVHDPSAQMADRLIHALFIRGDVSAADGGFAINFREDELSGMDAKKLTELQSGFKTFSNLGLFSKIGVLPEGKNFGKLTKIDLAANWRFKLPKDADKVISDALNQNPIRSETGEIIIDPSRKNMSVISPLSEALSGSGNIDGKILHVDAVSSPQTVALISIDGKPLTESHKILMLHLVDMANTNQTFRNQSQTILDSYGKAPLLVRRCKINIALNLPGQMKVETLDFSGQNTGTVQKSYENGILRFQADTALRPHGVMAYLLSRE